MFNDLYIEPLDEYCHAYGMKDTESSDDWVRMQP